MDAGAFLLPFQSPGVVAPSHTLVHAGFLNGYAVKFFEPLINLCSATQVEFGRNHGYTCR